MIPYAKIKKNLQYNAEDGEDNGDIITLYNNNSLFF